MCIYALYKVSLILYIIYNYILQFYTIFQEAGKLFPNIPHQETLLKVFSFYLIKYLENEK